MRPRVSLAFRFALVAAVVGALGAWIALLALRAQARRDFERQVVASASSVTELIRQATRSGMLHNRWDDVKEVIHNIHRQPDIVRIRLLDKKGDVVFSSDEAEIGRRFDVSAPECRSCHVPGPPKADLPREERVRIFRDPVRGRVLGMIEPLPGEAECSGACHHHPPGQRVLGVIDTQLSLASADATYAERTKRLLGAAIVVHFAAAAVMAIVVGAMLRRRLRPMRRAIARLGGGDDLARVPPKGNDELGDVALAFNSMAGDLQRTHEELRGWTRTLQDRVDERTRELAAAQDQMVRSERMACLGRLAAVVAHELNNPLAGVQVFARRTRKALAAGEPIPPERAAEIESWMEMVDREVGRCGRIVQDLLAFSRQRPPQRAPIDVNEVVRRATRLLGHKLDLEEIDLALRLDEAAAPVVADGAQIEQALLAVLINAVEAMPKGGTLTVETRPRPGGGIEIEVRDTGAGIPADILPRIFEPFFTTKPEGQGTGLGLSVVYGIVSRHGGRLDVDSAPGAGTRVTMVLPPDVAADDAGAPRGEA
ncbi:MAG: ATP-binding protein [Candidatus Polarisedimenticolia bacterium]|nr:HAMP domain-containing protein [bacterium]